MVLKHGGEVLTIREFREDRLSLANVRDAIKNGPLQNECHSVGTTISLVMTMAAKH